MLAFVDIEHEKVRQDPRRAPYHFRDYYQRVINIMQATGLVCHTVHYLDFSLDWIRANGIKAFFISGNTPDWVEYDWDQFKPLQAALVSGEVPVMAFCGGHQLVGYTYGAECGPLGPLAPGETDLMPEYHPGMRKEKGYLSLDVTDPRHPLFAGFPESGPVIMESHYWQINDMPEGFDLLASTPWCKIQVIEHQDLPIVATQGHPEAYTEQYPDGKRLIRNFALAYGVISE